MIVSPSVVAMSAPCHDDAWQRRCKGMAAPELRREVGRRDETDGEDRLPTVIGSRPNLKDSSDPQNRNLRPFGGRRAADSEQIPANGHTRTRRQQRTRRWHELLRKAHMLFDVSKILTAEMPLRAVVATVEDAQRRLGQTLDPHPDGNISCVFEQDDRHDKEVKRHATKTNREFD